MATRDFDLYVNPELSAKIKARYGDAVSAGEVLSICCTLVNRHDGNPETVMTAIDAMSLVMKNVVIVPHVEETEEDN